MLDGLAALLDTAGYSVIAKATSGREVLELNEALNPDVILLDVKMPDMDGIEVAKAILKTKPVPIIFCTAHYDESLILSAAEAGAYAYLIKPFHVSDLVPAITMAHYRCIDLMNQQVEVRKLREALEARKWIEKAKGIVMRNRNLDEDQAHRYLQMESQRRSQALADLARAIVTAEEMFTVKVIGQSAA